MVSVEASSCVTTYEARRDRNRNSRAGVGIGGLTELADRLSVLESHDCR